MSYDPEEINLMKGQESLIKENTKSTETGLTERNLLKPYRFSLMGLDTAGKPLSEAERLGGMNPLELSENELAKIKFNNLHAALNGKFESPQQQADIDKMTGVVMGLKGMSYEQARGFLNDHITALKDEANNLQLSGGTGNYLNQMDRMRAEREYKSNQVNSYLNRRKDEEGAYANLSAGYSSALVPYQNYRQLQQQAKMATAQNKAANKSGMMSLIGTGVGVAAVLI
jgi:hypothetical protein